MGAHQQTPAVNKTIVEQAIQWHMQLQEAAADEIAVVNEAFDAWLSSDSAHVAAYQRVQAMWQQFNVENIAEAKPFIESNLAATAFLKKKKSAKKAAKSIAALSVLGISTALIYHMQQSKPIWVAQYQTPIGQQRMISLPDNSKLVINTDTIVTVRYSKRMREILIDHGELYIQVAKDARRPLVVSTADGFAQALGTQFSVYRQRVQSTNTRVTVMESQVKACNLQRWYQLSPTECVVVSAGQSTTITQQHVLPLQSVDANQENAWINSKLVFDNALLGNVVAELQRYSRKPIILAPQLDTLRVSGVFPADNVSRSLELLANRLPIEVSQDAQGIAMRPRSLATR